MWEDPPADGWLGKGGQGDIGQGAKQQEPNKKANTFLSELVELLESINSPRKHKTALSHLPLWATVFSCYNSRGSLPKCFSVLPGWTSGTPR